MILFNSNKKTKLLKERDTNNKKKVRRNKKKFYVEERNLLISKLDNLLNIEKNNFAIVYDDLVENTELINFLNEIHQKNILCL
jgi:hypothetical protein